MDKIKAQSIAFIQCMFKDRGYTDLVTSTEEPFPSIRCVSADGVHVMAIFATVVTGNATVEMVKAPQESKDADAKTSSRRKKVKEADEVEEVEPEADELEDEPEAEEVEYEEEEVDETEDLEEEESEDDDPEDPEEAETDEDDEPTTFQQSDKDSKNMGVNLIKSLHEYALTNHIGIVVVVSDKLTSHAYKHAMAQKDVEFVHFTYAETGVKRLARHIYQPVEFRKIIGKDWDRFIKANPSYESELLRYSVDDALVKYYGLHAGDIVYIEDADRQTGLVVEYALIVENL